MGRRRDQACCRTGTKLRGVVGIEFHIPAPSLTQVGHHQTRFTVRQTTAR